MEAIAPWPFIAPGTPETGVRNVPTREGYLLGAELARFAGDCPGMCNECAFRKGTDANGCVPTVMAAVKCLIEGEPFYCHKNVPDSAEPSRLCAGYAALSRQGGE